MRTQTLFSIGGLIFAMMSAPVSAGEIQERLSTNPTFSLVSQKQPSSLELCIADAVSRLGTAGSFLDGSSRVVITASFGEKVVVAIELNGGANGTQVIGHIQSRLWDDRMRERISTCL